MKKNYHLLLMLLWVCLITSCSDSENETRSAIAGKDELTFGTALQTRATDTEFELSDTIGIYAVTDDHLKPVGNYKDNAAYNLYSLPDNWKSVNGVYYPIDGNPLELYSYYPYRENPFDSETRIKLALRLDQTLHADYTASDFCAAVNRNIVRGNDKVHLDFYHRLSQMVFHLIPGNGVTKEELQKAKISVHNLITDCSYSFTGGASNGNTSSLNDTVYTGTQKNDVIPCGAWSIGAGEWDGVVLGPKAIIVPQRLGADAYIEVNVGTRTFRKSFTTPVTLNSGESMVFRLTINNSAMGIETELHPWNTTNPYEGEMEEVDDEPIAYFKKMATGNNNTYGLTISCIEPIVIDLCDGRKIDVPICNDEIIAISYPLDTSGLVKLYGSDLAIAKIKMYNSDFDKTIGFDVSKCKNLKTLEVKNCNLEEIDVSKNTMLEILDVSRTDGITRSPIKRIDVSKNPNLKELNCFGTMLTELNVSENLKLEELYICDTDISEIDVSKNINLKTFNSSDTKIKQLDFSHNPNLEETIFIDSDSIEHVDCRNTKVTSFWFGGKYPKIKFVDFRGTATLDCSEMEDRISRKFPDYNGQEERGVFLYDGNNEALNTALTNKGWLINPEGY